MARDIWVLDAETDPFKYGRVPQPFLWGLYNGSEYHQFERTDDVAAFVREVDGICYAHNGGKFDYHFLIGHAQAYDDLLVIHGRIAKWRLGACEMRDSMNILPVPLASYQKEVIEYSIFEPDKRRIPENWRKIENYLRSDCVNLWNMVTAFLDKYGMHLTQASASMKLWQKMSGREVPDTGAAFFDRFKPFYYGGRVEAFYHGYERGRMFRVADKNSAYPHAMLEEHPFGQARERTRRDRRNIKVRDFYVVHGVARGCLPHRDNLTLGFPNDGNARTYFVTGHELLAALELDRLEKGWEILEQITFLDTVTFKDYILHHYEERKRAKQAGDKATALFSKLLMNSLYGKFGADPRNYVNHIIVPGAEAPVDDDSYPLVGYVGPWALVENRDKPINSRFYHVGTAASITGYQRAALMRQIANCDGLIYCDTDSVAAHEFHDIDIGTGLGQWTWEKDPETGCEEFDIKAVAGKKLYTFGQSRTGYWKYASKGAKLYPQEIVEVSKGGVVKYQPDVPTFSVLKPPAFVPREIRLTK